MKFDREKEKSVTKIAGNRKTEYNELTDKWCCQLMVQSCFENECMEEIGRMTEKIKRYFLFLVGLFVMALGIALMVKANLGISPISSLPYVFSMKFTAVSLGCFTILWNFLLILGQVAVLRRKFQWYQLIQIPLTLVFGAFVDSAKAILSFLRPESYLLQAAVLLFGCLVLALGVSLTVLAGVVMNSGEAFVSAVSQQTGKEFGIVKVLFDSSLVLLSAGLSFVFFGQIVGVREGTIIAALLSGFIIRFFNQLFGSAVENWLTRSKEEKKMRTDAK